MRRFVPTTLLLAALALAAPALAQTVHPPGVDVAAMDRSVAPGDSFYHYANGTWLARTEIPADRSAWSSGAMLAEQVDRQVAGLIQAAAREDAAAGSDRRRIGDYYSAFMDTAAIDARGLAPLRPTLDSIAAIADRGGLAHFLGSTLRADVDAFNATDLYTENVLGLWVAQDMDDPTRYSPFLLQGGLGMPDRSYYVDSSAAMAAIREQYGKHVAAMLELAGIAGAAEKAARIVALETKIAQSHRSREETGDFAKGNNHWSRADFDAKAPGLDWTAYFEAAGLDAERFTVWQPPAVTGLARLVATEPLETWRDYLAFHAIQSRAAVLPSSYVNRSFAFYGPVLSGAKTQRDRWKRAVTATNEALGFAVGRLYVDRYFPPEEKARTQRMVAEIMAAFGERIERIDWMAPATKREAKAKLAVLRVGVGYPDTWPSYAGLEVRPDDAFGNAERASLFHYRSRLAKLRGPVDRGEWVMTPQTVNAVNLPAMNAMNFPAAILQPPFFDPRRPPAMDYGAMGAIIGHEVSHSFDSQGAKFDSRGRLRNWWTPEDFERFRQAGDRLAAQYDAYRPFPDLGVNGRQTLGENIADVAGLAAAYDGYHRSLRGKPAPKSQGFSADQQFFLSYAQIWRGKSREPALRNQLLSGGHAPGQYRALSVRNHDAWYRAFDVRPGQRLYLAPEERVRIW